MLNWVQKMKTLWASESLLWMVSDFFPVRRTWQETRFLSHLVCRFRVEYHLSRNVREFAQGASGIVFLFLSVWPGCQRSESQILLSMCIESNCDVIKSLEMPLCHKIDVKSYANKISESVLDKVYLVDLCLFKVISLCISSWEHLLFPSVVLSVCPF